MKQLIGWPGRAASYLLYHSPAFIRRGLGLFLAFLWFDLLRIRRKVVTDNIAIAFPEMTLSERTALGRRSLRHLGINFVEYSFLPWLKRENIDQHFDFLNAELFERALAQGRGVLLLTLHLGNGDLACSALSVRGYPMVMVSKYFTFKWLNDLWFGMRERLGTKFVPPRNSSYALLKALKTKQAVVIPLDQFTGPPIGVKSTFFGVETGTAAGLAVMAERSKATVISVYSWRQPNGRHAIQFVREIPAGDATPELVTQRFNDELESFVRLHPDQWMWIHKRWKKFKY
ncbi:MAG: lysophospholipid acyltransferase family protein [Bdellovibrionales bacterium]|nr:lysophospholipid acyltransferase family protein [Bdellovibrionales bacterium]